MTNNIIKTKFHPVVKEDELFIISKIKKYKKNLTKTTLLTLIWKYCKTSTGVIELAIDLRSDNMTDFPDLEYDLIKKVLITSLIQMKDHKSDNDLSFLK